MTHRSPPTHVPLLRSPLPYSSQTGTRLLAVSSLVSFPLVDSKGLLFSCCSPSQLLTRKKKRRTREVPCACLPRRARATASNDTLAAMQRGYETQRRYLRKAPISHPSAARKSLWVRLPLRPHPFFLPIVAIAPVPRAPASFVSPRARENEHPQNPNNCRACKVSNSDSRDDAWH